MKKFFLKIDTGSSAKGPVPVSAECDGQPAADDVTESAESKLGRLYSKHFFIYFLKHANFLKVDRKCPSRSSVSGFGWDGSPFN